MPTFEIPFTSNLTELSAKLELAAQKASELQTLLNELAEQGVQIDFKEVMPVTTH